MKKFCFVYVYCEGNQHREPKHFLLPAHDNSISKLPKISGVMSKVSKKYFLENYKYGDLYTTLAESLLDCRDDDDTVEAKIVYKTFYEVLEFHQVNKPKKDVWVSVGKMGTGLLVDLKQSSNDGLVVSDDNKTYTNTVKPKNMAYHPDYGLLSNKKYISTERLYYTERVEDVGEYYAEVAGLMYYFSSKYGFVIQLRLRNGKHVEAEGAYYPNCNETRYDHENLVGETNETFISYWRKMF